MQVLVNRINQLNKHRKENYLFVTQKGTGFTSDGFRTIWGRLMLDAKAKHKDFAGFTFHDLRRKVATDIENISSREEARKLLGYQDQRMTSRYIGGAQVVKSLANVPNKREDED